MTLVCATICPAAVPQILPGGRGTERIGRLEGTRIVYAQQYTRLSARHFIAVSGDTHIVVCGARAREGRGAVRAPSFVSEGKAASMGSKPRPSRSGPS